MKENELIEWLDHIGHSSGGAITIVQTIRNAIMSASILASVALIALMGALATAHNRPDWAILGTIFLLILSATCSAISIGFLARLSFQTQFKDVSLDLTAQRIRHALSLIWSAVVLFVLALLVAALELWL